MIFQALDGPSELLGIGLRDQRLELCSIRHLAPDQGVHQVDDDGSAG